MGKSLDGLIRHLVDQIALCGEYGALPSDFIAHVKAYYLEDYEQVSEPAIEGFFDEALDTAPKVDGPFLEYVWKWLIRDAEIRVGKNDQYANLTLSEAEAANAFGSTLNSTELTTEAPEHHASTGIFQDSVPDEATQAANATGVNDVYKPETFATKAATAVETSKSKPGIRLYTSDSRMWYAITGHGTDSSRVKNLDFVCLSIIAASGTKGILQHDLIRISGQDKRSLPGRTDRLRDDGYIDKRRVTVQLQDPVPRLLHTSVCTLKRFGGTDDGSAGKQQLSKEALNLKRKKKPNEFKRELWAKVNANANANFKTKAKAERVEAESSEAEEDDASGQDLQQGPLQVSEETQEDTQAPEKRRIIPQWTAEMNVNNQIFDLVDQSGTQGMSFAEIRDNLFGENARKPLEQYISRLVDSWQLSQPIHLRHLAIIRDAVLKGKSPIYVYYTFKNFKNLVDSGKRSWEAVTTFPATSKKGKDVAATVNAAPDLDDYGFPKLSSHLFQGRHNDATLAECVAALGTGRLYFSAHDSIATTNSRSTKTQRPNIAVAKGRGRPRKYPKSGIPANILEISPEKVKHLHRSQEMAEKYQKSKIEDEVLRRIENGEDPVKAAHEVLEETYCQRFHEGDGALSISIIGNILHRFAGEPLPLPTEDMAGQLMALLPGLKSPEERDPLRKQTPYWPSMAAHTFPILDLSKSVLCQPKPQDSQAGAMVLKTRSRRVPPDIPYLPSIAAHSQPLHQTNPTITSITPQLKRKIGRPPKRKHSIISPPHFHYLPSVFAHSGSLLPTYLRISQESAAKRRKIKQEMLDQRGPPASRPKRESFRSSTIPPLDPSTELSAKWRDVMDERFVQQLSSIDRPHDGIFLGETSIQRKRKSEPHGTGGPHRLAVFRLDGLKYLDWFDEGTSSRGAVSRAENQPQAINQANLESFSGNMRTPTSAPHLFTDDVDKSSSEASVQIAGASISLTPLLKTFTPERPVPLSDAAGVNKLRQTPTATVPHIDRMYKPAPESLAESRPVPIENGLQLSEPYDTSGELAKEDATPSSGGHIEGPDLSKIVAISGELDDGHEASPDMVERSVEQPTIPTKPKRPGRPPVKLNRQGGSTALLRRDIIMGLVEKCDGVCPGIKELTLPFIAEWKKIGQEGTPEQTTVRTAVNTLCAAGKLQQITFSFQTKQGLTSIKTMLTRPDISAMDDRVKETQKMMIERHPYIYLPKAVLPGETSENHDIQPIEFASNQDTADPPNVSARLKRDPKRTDPHKRLEGIKRAMKKIERADEARLDASTRVPQDISSSKVSGQSEREIKALSRIARPIVTKRKVERLASAKKSARKPAQELVRSTTALKMVEAQGFDQPESFMWLPAAYAFSEENYEVDRPVLPEPTAHEIGGLQKAGQYRHVGRTRNLTADEQARHRMRQMADKAAQIERNHAGVSFSEPSSLYTEINSKNPLAPDRSRSPLATSYRSSGLRPGIPSAHSDIDPSLRSIDPSVQPLISQSVAEASPPLPPPPDSTAQFEADADHLMKWELETHDIENSIFQGWPFINYTIPHLHVLSNLQTAGTNAACDVSASGKKSRLVNRRLKPIEEQRPRIVETISRLRTKEVPPATENAAKRSKKKTGLKRRRLNSLAQDELPGEKDKPISVGSPGRPTKLRRIGGPRKAKSLGENGEIRLMTATMVVRTLTGGLEKRIDWVLVAKVFEPENVQNFIQPRYSYLYQRYKLGLSKMESDFQELFAKAYEEGTVPPIDYQNLADYDWKWLVDWTVANVDSVVQAVPDLPAERSELDELYTLERATEIDTSQFYEIDSVVANHARLEIINRQSYIYPLRESQGIVPPQSSEPQLATARTWVRANVLTPEATYNANAARTRLLVFPERIIEDALRTLLADRVLMTQNNGRLMPGRNYDVSEYFLSRLRKNLLPAHFHRATSYKRILDREIIEKGCADYSYTAGDGDVLAILNLIAHKRIVVVPVNPPLNKWGLTDGGYETRQMDKGRLNFTVEIRPLPAYLHGSPLHPLPPPPAPYVQQSVDLSGPGDNDDAKPKIPLWYDINDTLVPVMWDMALAAVMAVLAVRPGVSAAEIEKTVRPSLETWEIGEILEWMVKAGAGERAGEQRYTISEWWWMALEQVSPETNTVCAEKERVHGAAVDKGKGKEKGWGWGEEAMEVD